MIWNKIIFFVTTTITCMTNRKNYSNLSNSNNPIKLINPIYIPISDSSFSVYDEPKISISKSFYNIIKTKIAEKRYNLYLYTVRLYIRKAKTVEDLVKIMQYMSTKCQCVSADDLTELLVNCFKLYPITDIEMQQFSVWQQQYDSSAGGGIYNYVTLVFWTCICHAIQEREDLYCDT